MTSPPFTPNEALPSDSGVISLFPSQERTFRAIMESWMLWEHDPSGYHKLTQGTEVERDAATTIPAGGLWYNTDADVMQFAKSIGPFVWDTLSFPPGTRMLFQHTAAPEGWTKDTDAAYEDVGIRLTTGTVGTGGTAAFSTVFDSQGITGTVEGHALTEAELAAHTHLLVKDGSTGAVSPTATNFLLAVRAAGADQIRYSLAGTTDAPDVTKSGSTGDSDEHTHDFTGDALDLDLKFADVIVATKD